MNNLVQFLHVYAQNILNFVYNVWEMIEKIKTDVDRLLLTLITKQTCRQSIYVRFYLFHHLPNFENKMLSVLDTNM